MIHLLRANFYKLFRQKSFYVLLILSVLIALFFVMLFSFVIDWVGEIVGSAFSAGIVFSMILSAFSLTNNIGLLIIIGVSIFIGTEYKNGTIRNKIAIGHSRTNIFFANLITTMVYAMILLGAYIFIVSVIGFSVFGVVSINAGIFVRQVFAGIFIMMTSVTVANLIAMMSGSSLRSVLLNLGVLLIAGIFTSLMSMSFSMSEGMKIFMDVFTKIFYVTQSILLMQDMSLSFFLYTLISSAVMITLISVIGCLAFERKDLK